MAVKLVVVCLTLSCIFLCALGNMKITKEQLAQFKGADPTKYCGNQQNLQKFCSAIVQEDNGKPKAGTFKKGYPECQDTEAYVQMKSGKGTELASIKVIVCAWANEKEYYTYGKGQTSNKVMVYSVEGNNAKCNFWKEVSYSGN